MRKNLSLMSLVFLICFLTLIFQISIPTQSEAYSDKAQNDNKIIGVKANMNSDDELAFLLVKLEKRTRAVIGGHYVRKQEGGAEKTYEYKKYLIKNSILPAAVAGPIFADTVPASTQGRAWVKMVVPAPRNPKNKGDATALEMVSELKKGSPFVWKTTSDAVYYGEPIITKATCLPCHGEPAGSPDPYFPEYARDGWKVNTVIGGVISRVAIK